MERNIRVSILEDAAAFAAIYAPFVLDTRVSFEEEAPTVEETRCRIERGMREFPWLTLEVDGEVEGFVYASRHRERRGYRWAVDTTIYLGESARGKGAGRALYASLLPLLRDQGFVVAYAGIALPNAGSVGLHEALGFRPVALYSEIGFKSGAWHDVGWWGLDLAARQNPPGDPVPFSALGEVELLTALAIGNSHLALP